MPRWFNSGECGRWLSRMSLVDGRRPWASAATVPRRAALILSVTLQVRRCPITRAVPTPQIRSTLSPAMTTTDIVHAYRHLLRQSLRAIRFAKPARYQLIDRLRLAFRKGTAADFNPERIDNTLEFLRYAEAENGLEHKIVKNLLYVWWNQARGGHKRPSKRGLSKQAEAEVLTTAYDPLNHNIRMLNESMGMCLPAKTVRDPS